MRHQLSGEAGSKDSVELEASRERPAWGRAAGERVAPEFPVIPSVDSSGHD